MEPTTEVLEPPVVRPPERPTRIPSRPSLFERYLERWRQDRRFRRAAWIAGGVAAGCFITLLVIYLQFAAMIDRRLAEGAFSSTVGIYAAPRQIASGDPM